MRKQGAGSARKQVVGAISCLRSGKSERVQIFEATQAEMAIQVAIVTAMERAAGGDRSL
jgi:hypothetical protein